MNWTPIAEFSEGATKDKWVSFSDGTAVATRLIYPPMMFGYGLAFEPTHFMVLQLPNATLAIEPPTIDQNTTIENNDDICGLCGEPGADKVPHPIRWPGEAHPESELVHAECEQEECRRAHSRLSDDQRRQFLKHC